MNEIIAKAIPALAPPDMPLDEEPAAAAVLDALAIAAADDNDAEVACDSFSEAELDRSAADVICEVAELDASSEASAVLDGLIVCVASVVPVLLAVGLCVADEVVSSSSPSSLLLLVASAVFSAAETDSVADGMLRESVTQTAGPSKVLGAV